MSLWLVALGPGHLLVFLGMLLFWAGLIVLVVWAVRSYLNRPAANPPPPPAPLSPRQILDERLARGETTVEDYEKARTALERNP